jgi:hypothetical protein
MERIDKGGFAKRVREISRYCFDLGTAERLRLLAEEMEKSEATDSAEPANSSDPGERSSGAR